MIESVLAGTDGSPTATAAVARAIEVAHGLGARLQIVSAYEPVPEGRIRHEAMRMPSDPAWTGSILTGATRFLLGSVPNKVSHHAPCSVMIVRTS